MNVFIDTEFTDLFEPILISIGMVSDTGEEFYAEVPYPDYKCSAFVREAVLPLLRIEPQAPFTLTEMPTAMLKWFDVLRRQSETIYLCFDYQTDWDLFIDIMQYDIPTWIKPNLCGSKFDERRIDEYFRNHPGETRHHSLYDARANKYAYRADDVPA